MVPPIHGLLLLQVVSLLRPKVVNLVGEDGQCFEDISAIEVVFIDAITNASYI